MTKFATTISALAAASLACATWGLGVVAFFPLTPDLALEALPDASPAALGGTRVVFPILASFALASIALPSSQAPSSRAMLAVANLVALKFSSDALVAVPLVTKPYLVHGVTHTLRVSTSSLSTCENLVIGCVVLCVLQLILGFVWLLLEGEST